MAKIQIHYYLKLYYKYTLFRIYAKNIYIMISVTIIILNTLLLCFCARISFYRTFLSLCINHENIFVPSILLKILIHLLLYHIVNLIQ